MSDTMRACQHYAAKHGGELFRHPGGFWRCYEVGAKPAGPDFSKGTVEALVRRGAMQFCGWEYSRGQRFATRARLSADGGAQ